MHTLPNDHRDQPGLSLRWLARAVIIIAVALLLQGLVQISNSDNSHNTRRAQVISPGSVTHSVANIAAIEVELARIFPRAENAGLILNADMEKYLAQAYELLNENPDFSRAFAIANTELPETLRHSFPGKHGAAILQLFNCYRAYKSAESRAAITHRNEMNRGNSLVDYRPLQHYFFSSELATQLFSDHQVIYAGAAMQADVKLIVTSPERGDTPYPRSCDQLKHNEVF